MTATSGPISHTPLWLVINLDGAPQRLSAMQNQCDALGIDLTRVSAMDGRDLAAETLKSLPSVDATAFKRNTARAVRGGDIGCYMSHLRAMTWFLQSSAEFAVVMEDDAILNADTVAVVDALTAPNAPRDWDMVKLAAEHRLNAFHLRPVFRRYWLAVNYTRQTSAVIYVVNRRAAEIFERQLLPMVAPYDFAFDRGWALGLRTRVISPLVAGYGLQPSQIETAASPKVKSRGWHRVTRVIWELRNDCARVIYALAARVRRG